MEINSYPSIDTLSDDDLLLLQKSTDNTYRKVKLLDLKNYLGASISSGGSSTSSSNLTKTFTYVSDADTNGVFYWLGTKKGTQAWENPQFAGTALITMSSFYDYNHGHAEYLVDRTTNANIATQNVANSSYQFDLIQVSLKPTYYSIRGRDYPANNPANWKLLGSVDAYTWDTLDVVDNNPLSQNQWCSRPLNTSKSYYHFQLVQTGLSTSGDNIFCVAEIEFYGTVTYSS